MTTKSPPSLISSPEFDLEADGFFGQHMSATELDAEFLSRLEPSRFAGVSELQSSTWWGYRFMHPGYRIFLFVHHYKNAFTRCAKVLGKSRNRPSFFKGNPFADIEPRQLTGLVTATYTADAHGIPYDFWCETMMEYALRGTISSPPLPYHMYNSRSIVNTLGLWAERNEAGIYLARNPEYRVENYVGHPTQDAYQGYLLNNVATKGNKAFWLSRLIYAAEQVTIENATKRFGAEVVEDAKRFI